MKTRRIFSAARLSFPLATALVSLFAASHIHAQTTRTWVGSTASVTNGAWGTTTNWSAGDIPDTNTEIASFSADWTTANPTFALGANRTVNGVIYNDTGASGDLPGTIVSGSTLTLDGTTPKITTTNSLTINSILAWGTPGFTKDGAVTLILSGINTGTGPVTLSTGVIRATTSASALGTTTATLSMAASTTLQLANDTGLSFSRNTTISGTDSTITADRLTSAATSTTHTLGTLSIGAHTLNITRGSSITGAGVGGITFGTTTLSAGPAVFNTGADSNVTLGAVGGAFALTKQGAGQMTLGTTSTRTTAAGITNLSAGILRLNTANALNTLATAPLNISGGTLSLAVTAGATYGGTATTVSGASTVEADAQASTATVTQTLGTLSIGAQTLSITRGANITGIAGVTFGNANLTGGATFDAAANTSLTLGGTTGLSTFGLTKAGAGSVTATGVVSGTGTGTTLTVNAGTLSLSSNANTFAGDIAIAGATSVLSITGVSGGIFTTTGPLGNQASNYKTVTLTDGGTFRLASSNYNVGAPTATNVGAGQVFSIGTGGGTFDVASGSTFTLDDGSGSGNAWTNTQLQGSGTLTKTGAGALVLGNAATSNAAFTGQILVNAGVLRLGAMTSAGVALGATSANTVIASGAGFDINNNGATAAEPLSITGTGVGGTGNVIFTSHATGGSFSGPITLAGNSTIGSTAAGAITFNSGATFSLGSNTLTIRNTSTGRLFTDGVISGTGPVVMNSTGTGDYIPRADHTYSGGTTLTAGFTAVDRDSIGTPGSPTAGPFGTSTLNLAGGQIRSGSGSNRTIANAVTLSADTTFYTVASEKNLTFSGPVTLTGANRTLTSNVGATVSTSGAFFTGAIGDGGSGLGLTMAGTGNLILAGANTFTGPTIVNSGRLILSGSLNPASAISVSPTVAGGATLTLANGAANPVTSTAALNFGSATNPTTLGFDLGANTAASDSITTSAAATTTGAVNIAVQSLAGFGSPTTFNLINAASGLAGAAYTLSSAPGGYTYNLTSSATSVQLSVSPATAGDLYWRGDTSSSWSAFNGSNSNWYSDSSGTTNAQANPGAGDTVIFSASNATLNVGAISTTLNNHFTVNDIVFGSNPIGVNSVTIGGGLTPAGATSILTVAPGSSAEGLNVGANAGNVTISAPLVVGANQSWLVDGTGANGSSLTISGPLSGTSSLALGGLVTISSAAGSTYSGSVTVPNGSILRGGAANSFSATMDVIANGTGIVRLNGASNNIGALSGTGIVENGNASTAATLTVGASGTNTAFSGTVQNGGAALLNLIKTGAGNLTLSGNNTFTGSATVSAGKLLMGSTTALSASNAVTVSGTGTFDLNGLSITTGAITSADLTAAITNSSTSTAASTATALNTPSGAGVYVDAWTTPITGNVSALISDGATRKTQIAISNANGGANFLNDSNSFSGGLVLLHNASGTRLNVAVLNTGTRLGNGPIIIGQSPTDKAGIFFSAVGNNTISNPIIFNTALGTDRVGIRTDVAGITLSGPITANLAPATFTSNAATTGTFTLTNQVTGASGLVLDITSLSAAATAFSVTLNNGTVNPNNYQGDTVINLNAALLKSATLALGQANQIPNGPGTGNVVINSNGTGIGLLSLGGFSDTINGLSGNGNVDGVSGTPTLTMGDNNATATHSGSINNTAGVLSIAKIGTGTQTLSGSSNFTGSVTVNGGLLAFTSSPATGGPLGNSTLVNLSGGGISYTGTSSTALNRTVAIGATNGTLDVASSAGVLTMTGVTSSGGDLIKSGPGAVVISGSTSLNGGAADVAVNAGTLQAGFGTGGVATITVGAAGNLDQRNSAIEALVLDGVSGALNVAGGAQLGFDLSGAANDSITVDAGGTAATSGTVTLNFYGTPSAGIHTLLTAPSGLDGATYALGAAPNGFNYTITATGTTVTVDVQPFTPIYWRGGQNLSWNTLGSGSANWTTNEAGTNDATSTPVIADTVLFSATGAPTSSNAISTTLDGAFTVDSLQFTNLPSGIASVTIAEGAGGALALTPASASGGIRVLAGSGTSTISAPLTVGASQTWDVDTAGSLIVSGNTAFNANVNKTNSGVLTLLGTNTGTSTFTLSGGTLNLNSNAALGSVSFAIGAGSTIDSPLAARTLSTNNTQTWKGDFAFTGTNALNLGTGAVTINNSVVAVNTAASTLSVGGVIGDGGNNRILAKTGAGTLELSGANTFGGGLNLSAGTLLLGNNGALGSGSFRINGAATVAASATVVTANNIEANSNFTVGGTNPLTLGNMVLNANRTITNSNTALTTITGISGTTTNLTFSGDGNTTVTGAIATTTGSLAKNGTGILTLAGANTFTGSTVVSAGTVTVSGSISSGAGNITVGSGSVGTLTVANGGSVTTTGSINLGSGIINNSFVVDAGGSVSVGSINNPWATNYTVNGTLTSAGTWSVSTNTTASTFNGSGVISAPALTLGNATTGMNFSGAGTINIAGNVTVASNNGAGAPFYTQSSGTLNANGMLLGDSTTNTTGSRTFNLTGGRVNLGSGGIAATGTTVATKVVNLGAGTLGARADWSSSLNMALASLTPATIVNTLDSVDGSTARTVTLSGILSGTGSLTKAGAGTLVLSGANTYTGSTAVNGGTLQLNGSAATNPTTFDVTVGAAGKLGFTSGSASTLNLLTKDLTLNGGTLAFDVGNAGVNDAINVDDFILTANSALSFTSIGAIDGTYTLLTSTNPITNAGSFTLSGQTVGRVTLTPTINANTVTVTSSVSEGKWNVTGGGNWSDGDPNATAGNWLGYKPTVDGDAALFGDSITTPSVVLVDTPHTASYIRFENLNAYTIGASGSNNLTLGNSLGAALLSVTTGSHSIAENLALTSNLSILPSSGTALAITGNTSGSGRSISINGAGNVTLGGAIATTTGGLVKDGAGTLVMAGASSYLGNTELKGGTLNLTGSITGNTTTSTFAYGTTAGNTVVNQSGNLTAFVTTGANTVGSVSVFNQTAGSVTIVPANSNDTQWVGRTGYGALNITGGTFNTGRFDIVAPGGTNGVGVTYVGGGGTLNQNVGDWFILTRTNGNAQLTVGPGGSVTRASTVTAPFALTMDGTNSSATLNVAGGSVNTGTTRGLQVGFTTPGAGNTSFVNVASGTLSMGLNMIKSGTAGSTATFFNFAGGTVRSNAAMTEVITPSGTGHAITSTIFGPVDNTGTANDFAGGVTIDTNGFATTYTNVFNGASGVGVTQSNIGDVTVLGGNSGYIGAPAVNFSAPAAAGAAPASGYALISAGQVTGIVITNPGVYASGETPTITLTGGGGSIAPFNTSALSTPNASGGLTKTGAGVLTLTGASTYTGDTLISGGTLQLGAAGTAGSLSPSSAITNNANFTINRTDAVVQGTPFGTIGGTGSVTQAGSGTVTLNVANTYSGGTTITAGILQANHNSALGTGTVALNGGIRLAVNAGVSISNAVTLGTNAGGSGRGLIEAVGTSGTATVSGAITINNSPAAGGHFYAATGTTLHVQGAITSALQISQRDGRVRFSGGGTGYPSMVTTGTTIVGDNNGIATSAIVSLGGSAAATLDLNGFNQSLAGITKFSTFAATIGNSSTSTDSVLTTTQTSSYAGTIVDSVSSGTRKVGLTVASGSLTLTGANTYTGGTTVNQGSLTVGTGGTIGATTGALAVNNTNTNAGNDTVLNLATAVNTTVGSLSGTIATPVSGINTATINTQTGRTFTVNQTGDATFAGTIAGAGDFVLGGLSTNTLTLTGVNTFTGTTTVSAGTLALVGGSQASAITLGSGASLGFALGSPTTSTSSFNLSAGTIKISGTPTLPSYTLISSSTGITGTPVLHAAIPGYVLKKVGNTLVLENPYEVWAAANGATGGKTGDADGDGFTNLMEYAFGTNPAVGSTGPLAYSGGVLNTPGQPILEQDAGIYYAVFCRRADYLAAGLVYTAEFSNALSAWTPTGATPTTIATDGVIDVVRVPFLNFVPSDSGPQKPTFFHVLISQ